MIKDKTEQIKSLENLIISNSEKNIVETKADVKRYLDTMLNLAKDAVSSMTDTSFDNFIDYRKVKYFIVNYFIEFYDEEPKEEQLNEIMKNFYIIEFSFDEDLLVKLIKESFVTKF